MARRWQALRTVPGTGFRRDVAVAAGDACATPGFEPRILWTNRHTSGAVPGTGCTNGPCPRHGASHAGRPARDLSETAGRQDARVRIIAGSRKGHRIDAPSGRTTRPTSDRV